jgi:hypothetical protein
VSWLFQQPTAWQEILIGIVLMVVALFAEDWIDQWRKRSR